MSPAPDSTLADPQQIIANLRGELAEARRKLDERTAERDDALEQQSATAEVLGIINSSPGDLTPVFDAILEKARSLCGARFGALFLAEGELFRAVAMNGGTEAWQDRMRSGFPGSKAPASAPLLAGERFRPHPGLGASRPPVDKGGGRSCGRPDLLIGSSPQARCPGWHDYSQPRGSSAVQ